MARDLKKHIQKLPVEFFMNDPPDVNILCPFPKFGAAGVPMPRMLGEAHIQTLLAGPCSTLQTLLQDSTLTPHPRTRPEDSPSPSPSP